MRYFLYILIVVISAYASNGEVCEDPNAQFTECGIECEPTCEKPEPDITCNSSCVIGCQCLPGFVLHESKCVRREDCPKIDRNLEGDEECEDPNAEFNDCGSDCVYTCNNLEETLTCSPVCIAKCECIPGFVLHESKCIRPEDCPKLNSDLEVCNDPNAEYTYCGTNCPLTCEYPVDTGCDDSCYQGCQCKQGYLLHQNSCIKPEECPQI